MKKAWLQVMERFFCPLAKKMAREKTGDYQVLFFALSRHVNGLPYEICNFLD